MKKNFSRLHDFIDKWIDNDIWLAMSIDVLLKTLNRLLAEVAEFDVKDKEAAFGLYASCIGNLTPYLQIIDRQLAELSAATQTLQPAP